MSNQSEILICSARQNGIKGVSIFGDSLASQFIEQFKKKEYDNIPFANLSKNHIYQTLKAKMITSKFGDRYVIKIRDLDNKENTIISTFAPDSYLKQCTYKKIDIDESHYFLYKGMENKKDKEGKKYKVHLIEIIKTIEGYTAPDIEVESDEE